MAETVIYKTTFQFKRGKAATWTQLNPVLTAGEPGFELDTGKLKIGNGSTNWNNLPYLNGSGEISVDGKSLTIKTSGEIEIYGFSEAEENQIPTKGSDGKIVWKDQSEIESLTEEEILEICK